MCFKNIRILVRTQNLTLPIILIQDRPRVQAIFSYAWEKVLLISLKWNIYY